MTGKRSSRRSFLYTTAAAIGALSAVLLEPPTHQDAEGKPTDLVDIKPPLLQHEQRTDWLNVKDFGAKGDGIVDDTHAIQSVYSVASKPKQPRVVYFPPGRYRITKTLTVTGKVGGLAFIGHGRDSVLAWDGEKGETMYWSNGVHRSRYEGLTYDGMGQAGIGSEHRSMTGYETHIIYESCSFVGMECGIAVGKNPSKSPSAEIWYRNCLFKDTDTGLLLAQFNDYDNWIQGCVFLRNTIGVNSERGQFNVWNSHFLGSRLVDIRQGQAGHPSSIRWSTSHASKRFFETGAGRQPYPFTFQNNWIEGWGAEDGAIRLALRGPTFFMDNTFSNPPNSKAPVQLVNKKERERLTQAQLVLCGNTPINVSKLVDLGESSRFTSIPTGTDKGCLKSGREWFYQEIIPTRGKVFDAKRDFGATGDGITDDTSAIQQTIDAAKGEGKGSVAYLPFGTYRISRTLRVTGSNYTIESTGSQSGLEWNGGPQGVMLAVDQPYNVTISHLSCKGPRDSTLIRQTDHGSQSKVFYNNLHLMGPYSDTTGIELFELGPQAVVHIGLMTGCLRVMDSGQATILGTIKLGRTVIEGGRLPKTGFMGLLYHNDVHRDFALTVKDNQDLVVGDFYSEQNKRYLLCEGGSRGGSGKVTIGGSKMACSIPDEIVVIRNYEGRICITTAGISKGRNKETNKQPEGPITFFQTGSRPVDLILVASAFLHDSQVPQFRMEGSGRFIGIENAFFSKGMTQMSNVLPNTIPSGGIESFAISLNDFRRLGNINREMNYPNALRKS